MKITLFSDIKDFIGIIRALFIEILESHWADTLFESVSHSNQLKHSNSSWDICFNLSNCKQKRIHLFWVVLVLCYNFFIRFRYQAEYAQWKWDFISATCIVSFNVKKKHFYDKKNFSLLLILCIMLNAMTSPDMTSPSIKHPKKFIFQCCLICISPYFMLIFLIFFCLNLEARSIDFVFSLSKWILGLLSTKQSHILETSTFNYFWISLISLCTQTRYELSAYRKRWHLTACDMSLTYMKIKSGPKIEPLGTPPDTVWYLFRKPYWKVHKRFFAFRKVLVWSRITFCVTFDVRGNKDIGV